jgi:conjugal transfer/entry exclusion protein
MVSVTLFLQLLLLVLVLKQSEAVSIQCKKLQEEIDQLEQDIKNTTQLKHNNEEEAGRCEVSGCYIHVSSL